MATNSHRASLIVLVGVLAVSVSVGCVLFVVGSRAAALRSMRQNGTHVYIDGFDESRLARKVPASLEPVVSDLARAARSSTDVTSLFLNEPNSEDIAALAKFPEIQSLSIQGGKFSNESLAVLKSLSFLQTFVLERPDVIDDSGLCHLQHCRNLSKLELSLVNTDGSFLRELTCQNSLRRLWITDSIRFKDRGLHRIQNFKRLNEVVLWNCEFDGTGFGSFKELPLLQRVDVMIPNARAEDCLAHVDDLSGCKRSFVVASEEK